MCMISFTNWQKIHHCIGETLLEFFSVRISQNNDTAKSCLIYYFSKLDTTDSSLVKMHQCCTSQIGRMAELTTSWADEYTTDKRMKNVLSSINQQRKH